jgi:hypothetical protein
MPLTLVLPTLPLSARVLVSRQEWDTEMYPTRVRRFLDSVNLAGCRVFSFLFTCFSKCSLE